MTSRFILITGGAGYLGSQCLRDLAASANDGPLTIRIYDNLQHKRLEGLLDLPKGPRYEFVEGDILDRGNLERAMHGVGEVIHLAGTVTTPYSFRNAEWMQQVNCYGTTAVAEAALEAGVSRLVYASTAAVYGHGGPFDELQPLKPMSPYAASLAAAERELLAAAERGLSVAIVRLGSIFGYGPGMGFEDLISRMCFLAGVRKPFVIHGNGNQVRPLIHLRDAAQLLLLCLKAELGTQPIVNGVTLNPSVNEVVTCLQGLVPQAEVRYTEQDILNRISFTVDGSRARALGFEPTFDLKDGLAELMTHWTQFEPAEFGFFSHD